MRKVLLILSGLMLVMSAILFLMELDVPRERLGLLLSLVASAAGLAFFPFLLIWALVQNSEEIGQADRYRLAILGLLNAIYTGFLFTRAFSAVHAEAQTFARIAAVIGFLIFLPWLIARFDNKPVRWFMATSILFYAISAA